MRLYKEAPLHDLGAAAHHRRMSLYPTNDVTYVIDTTINYTNVCNVHCSFCAFFRPEKHGEGYTMSHDEVLSRVKFAADQGATQIMIQGGVNPDSAHRVVRASLRARSFRISGGRHSFALGLGDQRALESRGPLAARRARATPRRRPQIATGRGRRDSRGARAQAHQRAQDQARRMARHHARRATCSACRRRRR